MQKKRTSDWAINPIAIFLLIWIFQALGNVLLKEAYSTFSIETWIVLLIGTLSFLVGSGVAGACPEKKVVMNISSNVYGPSFVRFCNFVLFPLYTTFVVFPLLMSFVLMPSIALSEMRSSIVMSVGENDRDMIYLLYTHVSIVFLALLTMCYASCLSKASVTFVFLVGLIAGLLTFGRTVLLLFFVSTSIILYFQSLIKKKAALTIVCVFILMFFLLAIMLDKGNADNDWFENLYWNFEVYALSPLAALNNYIEYGEPDIEGLLLLPNFAKDFFGYFGISIPITPNVLPFVEVPLPTNVFTAYFPWYHDGGIWGVVFGFSMIGFLSSYLFHERYKSRLHLFLYAVSVYPLIMTIFEDQYLRAYTLWVLAFFWIFVSIIFQKGSMMLREANKG